MESSKELNKFKMIVESKLAEAHEADWHWKKKLMQMQKVYTSDSHKEAKQGNQKKALRFKILAKEVAKIVKNATSEEDAIHMADLVDNEYLYDDVVWYLLARSTDPKLLY